MSTISTRNYSKETSHYSRSSSYHSRLNNNFNSRYLIDDRPLSCRLIERDYSYPLLSWNWNEPLFFDRIRSRLDNDFFKWNYGLIRPIPIYYRSWNNSSSKIIPIQYSPSSSSINSRQTITRKSNNNEDSSSNFINRHDENLMKRENRLSSNDWPSLQEPPTRKRTSMTIYPQRPFIDQCDVPYYRQTPSTPTYPQSTRLDYY